ncbi:MAG: carboxylate-amine ligase, partial [Cyanobacteria bacterium P01_H01_bin.58]
MMIDTPSAAIPQTMQFQQLQSRLKSLWRSPDEFDVRDCQVLIVPSLSLDQAELQKIEGVHYYEERLLFS